MLKVQAQANQARSRDVAVAPPAWRVTTFRVLAVLGGLVFLVPLQQAISVPTNPGSWGVLGGAAAIGAGAVLAGASTYEWLGVRAR